MSDNQLSSINVRRRSVLYNHTLEQGCAVLSSAGTGAFPISYFCGVGGMKMVVSLSDPYAVWEV
jgi:hypothetical protein